MVNVYIECTEFFCDPRQYKPTNMHFVFPSKTCVCIPVPEEYVITYDTPKDYNLVLTLEGLRFVRDTLENTLSDNPVTEEKETLFATYSDKDFE